MVVTSTCHVAWYANNFKVQKKARKVKWFLCKNSKNLLYSFFIFSTEYFFSIFLYQKLILSPTHENEPYGSFYFTIKYRSYFIWIITNSRFISVLLNDVSWTVIECLAANMIFLQKVCLKTNIKIFGYECT